MIDRADHAHDVSSWTSAATSLAFAIEERVAQTMDALKNNTPLPLDGGPP